MEFVMSNNHKIKKIFLLPIIAIIAFAIFYFVTHRSKDLIVGTNPTFPPLEYISASGAEIIGPNVELVKLIAKDYNNTGYNLEIIPFTELFENLENGKIDISIGALAITDERKKLVDFSNPYYTVSVIALIRKDDGSMETIDSKEALGENKKIGTRTGSVIEATARDIVGSAGSYQTKASWNLIVHELLNGNIDAVIINDAVANVFILKYQNLDVLPITFETLEHGVAVKKGNKKLLNSINKTIDKLNASGEYQKFVDEYTEIYAGEMLDDYQSK